MKKRKTRSIINYRMYFSLCVSLSLVGWWWWSSWCISYYAKLNAVSLHCLSHITVLSYLKWVCTVYWLIVFSLWKRRMNDDMTGLYIILYLDSLYWYSSWSMYDIYTELLVIVSIVSDLLNRDVHWFLFSWKTASKLWFIHYIRRTCMDQYNSITSTVRRKPQSNVGWNIHLKHGRF